MTKTLATAVSSGTSISKASITGVFIISSVLAASACSFGGSEKKAEAGEPQVVVAPARADQAPATTRRQPAPQQNSQTAQAQPAPQQNQQGAQGTPQRPVGVPVNSFLWRAALDTVSFMPISQANIFSGTIITDWYSPAEKSDERFKVNVFILDQVLRADGVRVSTFRQTRDPVSGQWNNAVVTPETNARMEEAILSRARQFRKEANLQ